MKLASDGIAADYFDPPPNVGVILIRTPGIEKHLACYPGYPPLYSRIGFAHKERP